MKLVYSHLQKFLPDLKVEPQKLRDDLTMIGHFTNYFEEIEGEIVFDLDIKVNRGDCLGYYGIARDLSVYYNLPLQIPEIKLNPNSSYQLPIKVSTDNVKRVMAVKISGLENSESPDWLKTFIKCHGNHSINTIVDLTNYIMFLYGIPNHAFDTNKSGDELIWEMNSKYKDFISLDGTKLDLNPNVLMINNSEKALSLSFWGGEACAIDIDSNEIIIEMAIYNPSTVRQNSRQLKSTTEAATRLEKELDPELIPTAFNHLLNLIQESCGGHISSNIFDYYPQKINRSQIKLDLNKPSQVSGIEIPTNYVIDCLNRLGCVIEGNLITPPTIRPDISMEADLVEEVVRFWGYQKIPTDKPLEYKEVTDITPKEVHLIDMLKDKLVDLGYDEIITWPLVDKPSNPQTVITTQNSINTEVIYLRQNLVESLKNQYLQYERYKLINQKFFEIGKIYYIDNNQYVEKYVLGISDYQTNTLKETIKNITATKDPEQYIKDQLKNQYFAEIYLDELTKPDDYTPKVIIQPAYELSFQIITLDANVTYEKEQDPIELIKHFSQIIGNKNLWHLSISDIYHDTKSGHYRYTFRASYFNVDDKTAKELHLSSFGLTK